MGKGRSQSASLPNSRFLPGRINFNVPMLRNGIQRVVYTNDPDDMASGAPDNKAELGVLGVLAV